MCNCNCKYVVAYNYNIKNHKLKQKTRLQKIQLKNIIHLPTTNSN